MWVTKQLLVHIEFDSRKKKKKEWVNDDTIFIFGWTIHLMLIK